MFSSLKQKWGQQLGTLFVVLTIICFLGTASQFLTHLQEATWPFILWWILKTFVSTVVLWVPIAIGANQQQKRFNRQAIVLTLWIIGIITFTWAKFTTQPVTTTDQPSPELYVVQQLRVVTG